MKSIKLSTGQEVVVTKLPLKKYVNLLKGLQELPKHISGLEGMTNEEIFVKLPDLVADALPDVVRILSTAVELKEEEIYELGLDEVVDVFVAVIEENNYAEIYNKLKKVAARPMAGKMKK